MQNALPQMHLTLQPVGSDITGVTGRAIMKAILAGERAPRTWARVRAPRGQQDEATSAQALYGPGRAAPLWVLPQALERCAFQPQPRAACAVRLAPPLETFGDRSHGE